MIYESKPTILIPCNSPYLIPFHHIIIHVISLSSSSSQLYCPSFWKTYSLKILGIHSLTNLFVLFYLDDLNSWHQFRSYPLICYREFDKNFFLWYVNVCVGKESNEWSDQQSSSNFLESFQIKNFEGSLLCNHTKVSLILHQCMLTSCNVQSLLRKN